MQYTQQILGWMAEWLCSGLQSRLLRFDSGFSLHFKKMKVGIIGYGFVGKALNQGLTSQNIYCKDPKLGTKIEDLKSF